MIYVNIKKSNIIFDRRLCSSFHCNLLINLSLTYFPSNLKVTPITKFFFQVMPLFFFSFLLEICRSNVCIQFCNRFRVKFFTALTPNTPTTNIWTGVKGEV